MRPRFERGHLHSRFADVHQLKASPAKRPAPTQPCILGAEIHRPALGVRHVVVIGPPHHCRAALLESDDAQRCQRFRLLVAVVKLAGARAKKDRRPVV
jgi:hypothetical protein